MNTNQKWPRGSEWRKWDLHLHGPSTKLNDQFKSGQDAWDEYCRRLHDSDVEVFGITDYFSADCYFVTFKEYRRRYPNSSKVFFPNVELRTSYTVNKASQEVNVHLIFNSFQSDHEIKIKEFLSTLRLTQTDSAGRNTRAAELQKQADFEGATTNREFIQEALTATFGRDADLLNFLLVVTAANNDGLRAQSGVKRKQLVSDELDKFSNAFFGSSKNVQYFLAPDRLEDETVFSEEKPVLSGSDAHSLADVDTRLGQVVSEPSRGIVLEPTWIKADLTFEGLKQIIFEPRNRVFIGEEPEILRRVRENKMRYIEALNVSCIEGYSADQHGSWFQTEKIVFGKELVAIIGNKGSGKSAVTDIIGLLGNSHNQTTRGLGGKSEELFSFLNKDKFLKGGCARHFEGSLQWYEGEPDHNLLDAQVSAHLPEKVEYLPQKYLEHICSNIADDEFRATLNEVIFRYVKPQDQYNQKNLDDLIRYRTKQAEEDIAHRKQRLRQANADVVAAERKLTEDYRSELEERIARKTDELTAHASTRPQEKGDPGKDAVAANAESAETVRIQQIDTKLAQLSGQITNLDVEQVDLSRSTEELRQARQAIVREAHALLGLEEQYRDVLAAAGLKFEQVVKLTLEYSALDAVVERREQRLREIEALLSTEEDIKTRSEYDTEATSDSLHAAVATSLICQQEALGNQRAEIVERLGKPAREYQQYLQELQLWTNRENQLRGDEQNPASDSLRGLEQELSNVVTVYPENLRNARAERDRISRDVFAKKRGLTQFYNDVKESIDKEIAKCREQLGQYDLSIDAGLRFSPTFFDEFLKFINQSAVGSFRGTEEGRTILRTLTDPISDWENEAQVFSALNAIVEALHADKRAEIAQANAARDVFKQMKGQKSIQDLYDFIFGFDYLETKYDLKVDQKDLSELSPGERGGLLLIFYLMLDRQDTPLIIDQPEDNLDNKSVYQILVTFIKQAKKRRQIILVTHNPNLAVVADAEQIINVSIDKTDGKHTTLISSQDRLRTPVSIRRSWTSSKGRSRRSTTAVLSTESIMVAGQAHRADRIEALYSPVLHRPALPARRRSVRLVIDGRKIRVFPATVPLRD